MFVFSDFISLVQDKIEIKKYIAATSKVGGDFKRCGNFLQRILSN